jgi:hypothetical protein
MRTGIAKSRRWVEVKPSPWPKYVLLALVLVATLMMLTYYFIGNQQ